MPRLQLASGLLCCQGDAGADCNPVTHLSRPLCGRVEMWPTEQNPYCHYELTMDTSARVRVNAYTLTCIFLSDLVLHMGGADERNTP